MEKCNDYTFEMKQTTIDSRGFITAMNTLCQFYTGNICPIFKPEDITYENRQTTHESFSRINVSNEFYTIRYEYYDYDTGSHYSSSSRMDFILKKGEEKQISMQKHGNTITVQTTSNHFDNFCAYIKTNIEPIL